MADDPPVGPDWREDDAFRLAAMSPEKVPPAPGGSPRPWGPWATLGWSALVVAAMLATQSVVLVGFAVARLAANPRAGLAATDLESLATDGTVLAVATLASTPLVVGLVMLLAYVRLPIGDYLALRAGVPPHRLAIATLGMAAFLAASDALTYALGRPLVPTVMVDAYRSAWLPALIAALVACAPIGEEVLFRGFFYRGIADSRWGPGLAIGFSSIAWALMHVQYDLYGIATVYLMGLYLGLVRHWTGSLRLTILLHALANAVATAEAALLAGRGGEQAGAALEACPVREALGDLISASGS